MKISKTSKYFCWFCSSVSAAVLSISVKSILEFWKFSPLQTILTIFKTWMWLCFQHLVVFCEKLWRRISKFVSNFEIMPLEAQFSDYSVVRTTQNLLLIILHSLQFFAIFLKLNAVIAKFNTDNTMCTVLQKISKVSSVNTNVNDMI